MVEVDVLGFDIISTEKKRKCDDSLKGNMKKKRDIMHFLMIIVLSLLVFASCSKAYKPNNYKKKSKDCDCSRWR